MNIGTEIIAESSYHGLSLKKVERVTKTQAVLNDGTKLRLPFIDSCCAIGSSGYMRTRYMLATDELKNQLVLQNRIRFLSKINWSVMPDNIVMEAFELTKDYRN